MSKVKTALISVSDKSGIVEFAQGLCALGVRIISTGGTAKLLQEKGIAVTEISEHTGFPEILDGRVKTLHPKVHGGILSVRNNESHLDQMAKHDITGIDLVAVNLYPFEKTIQKPDVKLDEAIENIDIGGPAMIRSAAKNYKFVTIVVDSRRYNTVLDELRSNDCSLPETLGFQLAVEAFNHTYKYDRVIAQYFETLPEFLNAKPVAGVEEQKTRPENLSLELEKKQDLRYGENPHQSASFYVDKTVNEPCVANAEILHGKELSFNNIIDLNAALEIVCEFDKPASVVIKHTNPCGASCADKLSDAFINAYNGDPVSAFGSILGFNRKVDKETAEKITEPGHFIEAVIAPDYDDEVIKILTTKRKWGANLRILKTGSLIPLNPPLLKGGKTTNTSPIYQRGSGGLDIKKVGGGLLVQDRDTVVYNEDDLKFITDKKPSAEEMADLKFAFTISKHVKSNSIVLVKNETVVGVGAGQMSRIDSVEIAVKKAGDKVNGSVMASDAFFPFRDTVDAAAKVGVSSIIQPGGSNRDDESIAAANEHNISMLLTGIRHFKH
ncbi:MAG: bifunctional phosphoribosylaminoimidazolecarboxamide formyltransferase/IMP cyclohydrolase [Candidatus Anammoxibacter sp.]